MTKICAGTQQYDIACVVFDKDGTLMDFEQAWGRRIRLWIAALVAAADGEEALAAGRCKGHYSQYAQCGITIAVATADNRDIAEHCLDLLGIRQDVDVMMCGDDPLPQKPDPGVLAWIADSIGATIQITASKGTILCRDTFR